MLLFPRRRLQIDRRRGVLGGGSLDAVLRELVPASFDQARARADEKLDHGVPATAGVDDLDTGLGGVRRRPQPARFRDTRLQTDRAQ